MTASPPGRFSTTTDWPQRADSRSARRRAVISDPLPGPIETMNLTVRLGQACAVAGLVPDGALKSSDSAAAAARSRRDMVIASSSGVASARRGRILERWTGLVDRVV